MSGYKYKDVVPLLARHMQCSKIIVRIVNNNYVEVISTYQSISNEFSIIKQFLRNHFLFNINSTGLL